MRVPTLLLAALLLAGTASAAEPAAKAKPFVMDYYYKVAWGHQDEFWRLFKKNHLPVLEKERELGRILSITAAKPMDHGTEDGRWDYRVTITWKDIQTTDDDFDSSVLAKQLYPDQETFKKEEQRRFEILLGHWDVPMQAIDLK